MGRVGKGSTYRSSWTDTGGYRADIKLDEHIAISKVDTDAVVKLRANEATAYDSFITSKNSIDEISSSSLLDIDAIRPKLKTEPDTAFF